MATACTIPVINQSHAWEWLIPRNTVNVLDCLSSIRAARSILDAIWIDVGVSHPRQSATPAVLRVLSSGLAPQRHRLEVGPYRVQDSPMGASEPSASVRTLRMLHHQIESLKVICRSASKYAGRSPGQVSSEAYIRAHCRPLDERLNLRT